MQCLYIERLHERIAHIFRHLLFRGNTDIMAGICRNVRMRSSVAIASSGLKVPSNMMSLFDDDDDDTIIQIHYGVDSD